MDVQGRRLLVFTERTTKIVICRVDVSYFVFYFSRELCLLFLQFGCIPWLFGMLGMCGWVIIKIFATPFRRQFKNVNKQQMWQIDLTMSSQFIFPSFFLFSRFHFFIFSLPQQFWGHPSLFGMSGLYGRVCIKIVCIQKFFWDRKISLSRIVLPYFFLSLNSRKGVSRNLIKSGVFNQKFAK